MSRLQQYISEKYISKADKIRMAKEESAKKFREDVYVEMEKVGLKKTEIDRGVHWYEFHKTLEYKGFKIPVDYEIGLFNTKYGEDIEIIIHSKINGASMRTGQYRNGSDVFRIDNKEPKKLVKTEILPFINSKELEKDVLNGFDNMVAGMTWDDKYHGIKDPTEVIIKEILDAEHGWLY